MLKALITLIGVLLVTPWAEAEVTFTPLEKDKSFSAESNAQSGLLTGFTPLENPAHKRGANAPSEFLTGFTDVTQTVGLSGGAGNHSVADYNNDGYLDILMGNRLFKNSGPPDYKFIEVTDEVGIGGAPWGSGVFGDYDNDGYSDILTNKHIGDTCFILLYRNSGPPDYKFSDVSEDAMLGYPILEPSLGIAMAWLDYDNDSYLDFYVCNYETELAVGHPDYFFHNKGNGTFSDVSTESKIASVRLCSRGVNCADFDEDGDVDIYVSVYRLQRNLLWQNNSDGTFTEIARTKNVEGHFTFGYYGHTIGSAWGDFNNDGYFDLFCANLAHKDPDRGPYCDDSYIFKNNGPPDYKFTDIRETSGIPIHPVGSTQSGYYYDELFDGVAWGDYDNDGFLDLYITQVYNIPFAYSFVYKNNGDETFSDVTQDVGSPRVWDGWGPVWFDYDNDGDLDILTFGSEKFPITEYASRLYKNNGTGNNCLEVDLEGKDCNRFAIGAVVKLWTGNGSKIRQIEGGTGNYCQNPFRLHFGLGQNSVIDSIEITWPCDKKEKLTGITPNQIVKVVEKEHGIGERVIAASNPGRLLEIRPNPATNRVEIQYILNKPMGISLKIYDIQGVCVRTLIDDSQNAGDHIIIWSGLDQHNRKVPNGIYFCQIRAGNTQVTKKILLTE